MRFIDAGELPSICEHGEITYAVLFLGGGGEGKAFECLKEVMEKSTFRSLTVSGSVIPNY